MKPKKLLWIVCTIYAALCIATEAPAQQARSVLPVNATQKVTPSPYNAPAAYSFRLYNAPNNMYGYDILQNGKPVYHQFVLTALSNEGKRFFASGTQAETAAALAIEKIKKGQPPALSNEEILKIISR
jgi:hypothetical protein